jgi:3-oxoacyl-[acyl-carrier protein] reductase
MNARLQHPVVVVTGASRGLGRAIALRFGEAGGRVVVNYLSREREASDVCGAIARSGGEALIFRADVGKSSQVDAMMASARERWGTVDALVNNAGITRDGLLLRMSERDWDEVLSADLTGPFYCIRAATRVMSEQRHGHIINIASISGVRGKAGQANYAAAKAGLIGLTRSCAAEFGPMNISINAVLPGFMETDMGVSVAEERREGILKDNALGRASSPYEVAEFVYRLSLMQNVSGQVFNLDSRVI